MVVDPLLVGPLDPGQSAQVQVSVTIPAGALNGAHDDTSITFVSALDETIGTTATLTTTTNHLYGVEAAVTSLASQADYTGATVTFTIELTNTGNDEDDFDVVLVSDWLSTITSPIFPVTLATGASVTVTIETTIPLSALEGEVSPITLTFTSLRDPGGTPVSAVVNLEVQALHYHAWMPQINK